MTGKKNSCSTDALIDDLFDALFVTADGPLLDSHMTLKPDPAAQSYFIAAPRPVLTVEEMSRPDMQGPMDEFERLLADMPADRRATIIAKMQAVHDALADDAQADSPATPPSLIYALH